MRFDIGKVMVEISRMQSTQNNEQIFNQIQQHVGFTEEACPSQVV